MLGGAAGAVVGATVAFGTLAGVFGRRLSGDADEGAGAVVVEVACVVDDVDEVDEVVSTTGGEVLPRRLFFCDGAPEMARATDVASRWEGRREQSRLLPDWPLFVRSSRHQIQND